MGKYPLIAVSDLLLDPSKQDIYLRCHVWLSFLRLRNHFAALSFPSTEVLLSCSLLLFYFPIAFFSFFFCQLVSFIECL